MRTVTYAVITVITRIEPSSADHVGDSIKAAATAPLASAAMVVPLAPPVPPAADPKFFLVFKMLSGEYLNLKVHKTDTFDSIKREHQVGKRLHCMLLARCSTTRNIVNALR